LDLRSRSTLIRIIAAVISCATWLACFSGAQNGGTSDEPELKIQLVGPVAGVFSRASICGRRDRNNISIRKQRQSDSFVSQTKSALERIEKQLADVGPKKEDIVELTVYVANLDAEKSLGDYGRVQKEVLGTTNLPVCTNVGVASPVGAGEKQADQNRHNCRRKEMNRMVQGAFDCATFFAAVLPFRVL
jgi:hypothetical protein